MKYNVILIWCSLCFGIHSITGQGPDNQFIFDKTLSNYLQSNNAITNIYQTRRPDAKCSKVQARWTYYLGLAYYNSGQVDSALTHIQNAQNCFQRIGIREAVSQCHNKSGDILTENREFHAAFEHYEDALLYLNVREHQKNIYEIKEKMAIVASKLGEHEQAEHLLKSILSDATQKNHSEYALNVLRQLADNYYSLGVLDSSVFYYKEILEGGYILDTLDNISVLSTLGNLYNKQGDHSAAQTYLIEALEITESQKDSFFLLSLCTDIARLYQEQRIYDHALTYSQRALKIAARKQMVSVEAANFRIQGDIYKSLEMNDKALENYEAALVLFSDLKQHLNSATIEADIASLYTNDNNYAEARVHILKALAQREHSSDPLGKLQANLILAEIDLATDRTSQAVRILESCLIEASEMNHPNSELKAKALLSNAYEKLGKFNLALAYNKAYHTLHDSMLSLERAKIINDIETKYELEKKDRALFIKEQQLDLQKSKIKSRTSMLSLLGVLSLVLVLVTILLSILNRKNRQIGEQKLEVLKKQQETQHLKAVIEGEDKERKRIARELHDDLGTQLAGIKVHVNALQNDMPSIVELNKFQVAENLIDHACTTIREISHNLMPSKLYQKSLDVLLEDLARTTSNSYNLPIDFQSVDIPKSMSDVLVVSVYRIVQELLRNIIKHARASEVILQIAAETDYLHLIVEDNGIGFNPEQAQQNGGIGLENIQTRLKYLGGQIDIHSDKNVGSTFTIDIPIK